MKTEKPLSEKEINIGSMDYDCMAYFEKDVKEAVEKLKEENADFELKVIGLVWGLCAKKEFDAKYFNIKMKEFGMNHRRKIDKIFGDLK